MDLESGPISPTQNNENQFSNLHHYVSGSAARYQINPEKESSNKCILGTGICCGTLGILGLAVTYIVFTIMGLVQTSNYSVTTTCPGSSLWLYSLLALILGSVFSSTVTKCTKKDDKCIKISGHIFALMYLSGLMGWGLHEVLSNQCILDNMYNTLLYKMSIASVGLEGFALLIHLCVLFVKIMCN